MELLSDKLSDVIVDCVNAWSEIQEETVRKAIGRFAAYEEIGLTPEEVRDMVENIETRMLIWFESKYGFPVGELMSMCEAKQNGRLAVFPCKVGDTVWFIRPLEIRKEITETTIEKMVVKGRGIFMKLACNAMYETSCTSIGKTVFLTCEEAEKALEEMEDG